MGGQNLSFLLWWFVAHSDMRMLLTVEQVARKDDLPRV